MKKILNFINKASDILLCAIRKWWRPITCLGMALSIYIHGVWLPMKTLQPADLIGLTGLVTAVVAAFAVREWGKAKGTVE